MRRILARGFLLLLFGSALFLTIRLAVAEAGFRRDPEAARRSPWLRAVSLNPRLSSAWIHLGLDAEADGNLEKAEQDLLQAARVDHLHLPAWTLANFYFRRGDPAKFWPWAQRAAALIYDDYRPLLRLADAWETSPEVVVARLAGGAPLLRAYLDVLIGSGRLDAAQEIAGLLAERHDPLDRARLAAFADRVSHPH